MTSKGNFAFFDVLIDCACTYCK